MGDLSGGTTDEPYQDLARRGSSPPPNDDLGQPPWLPQLESYLSDEQSDNEDDEDDETGAASNKDDDNDETAARNNDDDEDEDNDGVELPTLSADDPWPQPVLPKLALAKDMIEDIRAARLEEDLDEELLANLRYPPEEPETLDHITLFSMAIFENLVGCSERTYARVRDTVQKFSGHLLDSHHIVKTKIRRTTGVTQLQNDMCVNSCIAFVGPFKELDKCPKCCENRYEEVKKTQKMRPRQQFYTIPLGPQIQAMWRTPKGADHMRY